MTSDLIFRDVTGNPSGRRRAMKDEFLFEISRKHRKGFPSETNVQRGFPRCARRQGTL
jgi:hypothetical protein